MEYKDYYKILGVPRDADPDLLKRSYRKLARKYHPDVSKEANAEAKFKEINEAYEALKDPQKRAQYDQFGHDFQHGQSFTPPPGWGQSNSGMRGDFSHFFENMFGTGGAGSSQHFSNQNLDVNAKITISLEEAFTGTQKHIRRPQGAKLSGTINVKIPAGVIHGKKIRLAGQGKVGRNGRDGDLLLEVQIAQHTYFDIDQATVTLILPVSPWEAALGAKVTVPTLAGKINLTIPKGAKSGQKMRLKGRGLKNQERGDQIVILQIVTPPAETIKAEQFYQEMAQAFPFDPRASLK